MTEQKLLKIGFKQVITKPWHYIYRIDTGLTIDYDSESNQFSLLHGCGITLLNVNSENIESLIDLFHHTKNIQSYEGEKEEKTKHR